MQKWHEQTLLRVCLRVPSIFPKIFYPKKLKQFKDKKSCSLFCFASGRSSKVSLNSAGVCYLWVYSVHFSQNKYWKNQTSENEFMNDQTPFSILKWLKFYWIPWLWICFTYRDWKMIISSLISVNFIASSFCTFCSNRF